MLNNFKFDYAKKYHYLIKYILMAIPLFLLILSYLFPIKQLENNYNVDDSITTQETIYTDVNFNQLVSLDDINYTNVLTDTRSIAQLTVQWQYLDNSFGYQNVSNAIGKNYFKFNIPNDIKTIRFKHNGTSFDLVIWSYNINLSSGSYLVSYDLLSGNPTISGGIISNNNMFFNLTQMGLDTLSVNDFKALFPLDYYSYTTTDVISVETLKITETINDNSSLISTDEIKANNTVYLKPLNDFYHLNINSWYDSLLTALNINVDNDTTYYIYHIPLYIIYFYIFDIILDIFAIIFRLGHKLINKFGGDY